MTLESLKAKRDEAIKARQSHIDNANAAQGAVLMLEMLIKEEEKAAPIPNPESCIPNPAA